MKLILLTIGLILSLTEGDLNISTSCRQTWTYSKLDEDVNGTIVFYEKAPALCGYLSSASIALVRTDKLDTIRVLTLCGNSSTENREIKFNVGDKVQITPERVPSFKVDLFAVDPKECEITETFFGKVQSK